MMPPDPYLNPLQCNLEQANFVNTYYPGYIYNPTELFQWLYNMALMQEQQNMMRNADNIYKSKHGAGGRQVRGKGKKQDSDEEYDEDTTVTDQRKK